MPKKKSVKLAARSFLEQADQIVAFEQAVCAATHSKEHTSWCYDYAIIRLYRSFEQLMLEALIGAINNNARLVASHTNVSFPAHLSDDACEFLITSGGYFDFKDRANLIKQLKRFLPASHYLVTVVADTQYSATIERLSALRNFAAHDSGKSKRAAKKALTADRLSSAGAWLKNGSRLRVIADKLKDLAATLEAAAPY